jgi:sulfite reductase (ferredoxin)
MGENPFPPSAIHSAQPPVGENPFPPSAIRSQNPLYKNPLFQEWQQTNVARQRNPQLATRNPQLTMAVTIHLPLGDMTSEQSFHLADIARKYASDNLRTTVDQNILLRGVAEADLPQLYDELNALGLATAGAGSIVDVVACPGTDTCKLGIASSRGLANELRNRLTARMDTLPDAVKNLKIKISGCFNSCGQHHIADIGFFGNIRLHNNRAVPHFQVVLGGTVRDNAGSYGLAMGAIPSKAVPDALEALANRFVAERQADESFQSWVARLGKQKIKETLAPFVNIPAYEENPAFYSDWGDPREFTVGDRGIGECAGEVVALFSMEVAKAEGEHFDALLAFDEGNCVLAEERAYRAMLLAARALVRSQGASVSDDPVHIVSEFRTRFYDTQLFFDKYAGGKFAHFLFDRHEIKNSNPNADTARKVVEEAQLFIEAAHACDLRLAGASTSDVK